jgi:hypothetical protein
MKPRGQHKTMRIVFKSPKIIHGGFIKDKILSPKNTYSFASLLIVAMRTSRYTFILKYLLRKYYHEDKYGYWNSFF